MVGLVENRYDKMIDTLLLPENSDLPVVVWGGAALGRKIALYLSDFGINIDAYLVDREYYDKSMISIDGINVCIADDFIRCNKCAVIIAYRGFKREKLSEEIFLNIKYLFDYDFIGKLVLTEEFSKPITNDFLENRKDDVKWIYDNLEDQKSEESLNDFLTQRIYGNYSKNYIDSQYFQEDIIQISDQEVFVDCGAFRGETVLDFIKYAKNKNVNTWKKIITFEPEPENYDYMRNALSTVENIEMIQAGVYSESTVLHINTGDGSNSAISQNGDFAIPVKSIDDVLDGDEATFIKMDVEGSEMSALIGAERTIRTYKPKLAICIYHKREDFIDIPRYIKSLRDDYKFYIRNHDSAGIECVLYAI